MGYLIGHLVGDYLLQNDRMAQNKKGSLLPPREPNGYRIAAWEPGCGEEVAAAYDAEWRKWLTGSLACLAHVALYTLAVWAFTQWPWWAMLIVAVTHFIQDRTNIIGWWMRLKWKDQSGFASAPLAPWSIIVVDNVWHLVVLHLISLGVS